MSAAKPTPTTALELTELIAAIADDKQAEDIVALEVGDLVGYTDYLLICTARNERLAKAIHNEVYVKLKHEQDRLPAPDGRAVAHRGVGRAARLSCRPKRSDEPVPKVTNSTSVLRLGPR